VTCGRLITCAGDDRRQVQPVRRPGAPLVLVEPGGTALQQSDSADSVAASSMREAHTELGEPLPQVAFFVRSGLPTSFEDLMRREGPPLSHQPSGELQGLRRRQWLLRNRFDAGSPIGQRSAESITRSLLTWSTGSVPVPVLVAGQRLHPQDLPRMIPNAMSAS